MVDLTRALTTGFSATFLLLAFIVSFASAVPAVTVLQEGANGYSGTTDTMIASGAPTNNYGSSEELGTRQVGETKSLIRFDLSAFSPSTSQIRSAALDLYLYNSGYNGSGSVNIHRVLPGRQWIEMEATWSLYDAGSSWATAGLGPGLDYDSSIAASWTVPSTDSAGWRSFNVTSLVQQWISGTENNGMLIQIPGSPHSKRFASSDYSNGALRPRLTIVYEYTGSGFPPYSDSQPPSISGTSSSGITQNSATIAWSTSELSDTQVEYGPTTSYGSTTSLNSTLSTSHSTTLTGLSYATTYHYRVRSRDAAGNLATSPDLTFTTLSPPDSIAPSVSLTNPGNNAILTNTTIITATASDNIAIAGVQFLLNGIPIGSEATTSPYMISWNTLSVSNGTYAISARARDVAGNNATSSSANVYVNNYYTPPPPPPPPPAGANLYTVGPAGRNFTTIQQAINVANPGDIIQVDGDASYDAIRMTRTGTPSRPITIRGIRINGRKPVITGTLSSPQPAYSVYFDGRNGNFGDYIFEGFEINPNGDLRNEACMRVQANNVILRDLTIHNCPRHGILSHDWFSGNLTIEYVEVYDSAFVQDGNVKHPIYVTTDNTAYPGTTFKLRYSYIHNNGGNGIKTRAERNEIYYNWIEFPQYYAIELIGPEGTDIASIRKDSDVVGNVFVTDFGQVSRIGGDKFLVSGGGSSFGRVRFAHNTFVNLNDDPGSMIRITFALESLELINNIFYYSSPGAGRAITYERDTCTDCCNPFPTCWTTGSPIISGWNNWINTGAQIHTGAPTQGISTVSNTIFGSDPGFVSTDPSSFDPRLRPNAQAADQGSLSTTNSNSHPVPRPLLSPIQIAPVRRSSEFMTLTPTARTNLGSPDLGAFEASGGGIDSTPPVRSNGQPSGTLPAGTTSVILSISTNEQATCRSTNQAGISYSAMGGAMSAANNLHQRTLTDLTSGSHTYYVRCQDSTGNSNINDYAITFSIPASQSLEGDVNLDGTVNILDIQLIVQHFGKTSDFPTNVDLAASGNINLFDVMVVVRNWGRRA